MASVAFGRERFPPNARIHWAGFVEDAFRLQHYGGWEFALSACPYGPRHDALHLIARQPKAGIVLSGRALQTFDEAMNFTMQPYGRDACVDFEMDASGPYDRAQFFLNDRMITSREYPLVDFRPEMRVVPLSKLNIFHEWDPQAKEIITDPETVENLLSKIKQLQAPELAKIRQNNRDREKRVVHAQLITLEAA